MPKVSIIVPVYRVEPYIRECIQSILSQTYTDFELLLIDDGSPDNCPMICDEFAHYDKRVHVLHLENSGVSAARNAGLDVASGDYIAFVDSDDYLAPNMLEVLLQRILKDGTDIAACNCVFVDESGQPIKDRIDFVKVKSSRFTRDEFILYCLIPYGGVLAVVWNKLYPKSIFDSLRFPVGKRFEDEFILHHIMYNCQTVSYVNDGLCFYRVRQDSFMRSKFSIHSMDYCDALLDRYHFTKARGNTEWKCYSAYRLSHELDKWRSYAKSNASCHEKYKEICKRSRFLLWEKAAWRDYGWKGRAYRKMELIAPGTGDMLQKLIHRNQENKNR